MRRIDLHCYPGTAEWIASQQPFPEALARYWNKPWEPRDEDDVVAAFPALTIIAAHPGWPWVDEMTAVALHKGNVYWELSGWAPRYYPAQLRTDIRRRLRDKIMFGTDHPSIPLERLLREWDELGYAEDVMHQVFHGNAERVLGL
jgi:predicted TIM-barrel fold metal-dependent hydrolase